MKTQREKDEGHIRLLNDMGQALSRQYIGTPEWQILLTRTVLELVASQMDDEKRAIERVEAEAKT